MQKKESLNYFIFIFILAITIFAFGKLGFLRLPISIFSIGTSPIRQVFSIKPTTFQATKTTNELLSKIVDEKKLTDENSALKDQFQKGTIRSLNLLPAKVLGSPTFVPGVTIPQEFVIDKGRKDGIAVDQAVVVGDSIIGKIIKVSDNFSVANLLTNPDVSLTAKTNRNALGVVKGVGDEEVILDNVVLSDDLEKGDLVYTKGDINENGNGVPPDLLIGKIVSIDKKSSSLFQQASIQSFIDVSKLSDVFILIR